MDIREAIEKAGPGGRIKRNNWDKPIALIVPKDIGVLLLEVGMKDREAWIPTLESITATDWEVVKDEVIEVGDKVRDEEGVIWTVEAPDTGYMLLSRQRTTRIAASDLTLIHKGPKVHTFFGVEIYGGYKPIFKRKDEHELQMMKHRGKTYRMELIEEVE